MGDGKIKIITAKSFDDSFTANLVKSKLESEGIECFLTNENITTLVPNYTNMLNMRICIMIKESDIEKAIPIINSYEATPSMSVCPNCKSTNIKSKYGKYNFPKWAVFLMSAIIVLPFVNTKYTFVCKDCNTEF